MCLLGQFISECQTRTQFGALKGVPLPATQEDPSMLKEIIPEYSLEGLLLKLKLQYFGYLMQKKWLIWKDPDAGKDWRQEEKGMTEDEIVGWHHWHNGREFEQAPGVDEGQGSLACCSSWGYKASDTTEWLNWYDTDGPNIPGSYATLLFIASEFTSISSHIHNWVLFLLWLRLFILSGVISTVISSSILGTYQPGHFIFQYHIILPFHTVHGVLRARILKWLAISLTSRPHFIRTLHQDAYVLGGPTWHGSLFHWVRQGCDPCDQFG